MLGTSLENLLLALIVVVPGFIATHVAVTLGVLRTEISKWRLIIISLASSLFVVTLFLWIVQLTGQTFTEPTDVSNLFFTPQFRPGLVLSLMLFSIIVGLVGAYLLARDVHRTCREWVWNRVSPDRRRNFHEPWEGTLDNATHVQVLTSDNDLVAGELWQYSDDGKEKQIAIKNATWEFSDTGELVDSNADVELIMGGDIQQISVLTPSERQLEEENDEEEIHDETHSMPN